MGKEFSWKQVKLSSPEAPAPRRYFTAVHHQGRFFLFGGQMPNKTALDHFHIFDPKDSTYVAGSREGSPPPPRGGHSAVVHDSKLYIFGGIQNKTSFNDLFVYDFVTQKWEEIKPEEGDVWPSPREFHSAVVYGDHFFLYGGSNGIKKYKNDLFKFNFATRKFTAVAFEGEVKPEGRAGHLAFLKANQMIISGGFCGDGGFTYLTDSFAISLDEQESKREWKPVTFSGVAASTAKPISSAVYHGNVYVFGGYAENQPSSLFTMLDLEASEWKLLEIWMTMDPGAISSISASSSTKITRPFARYGHATAVDEQEGTFYVFAGTGSMYLADILELAPLD